MSTMYKPDYKYYDEKPYAYKDEECDPCDCKPKTCKAKECHFCPKPVILECACGTGANIPSLVEVATPFNIPLVCLTIDTTCLCKPVIKLDFCSIITTRHIPTGNVGNVDLKFRLCKTCDGGKKVCCGTWDFSVDLGSGEELTTSFNFCHCEFNTCPGCCIYTVEIFSVRTDDAAANIYNTTLSALAVSAC